MDRGIVAKRRYIWQPGSLRLAREATWADFARRAIQAGTTTMMLRFPATSTSWGVRVTSLSEHLAGEPLLSLLYQPDRHDAALNIGMAVLDALHEARLQGAPRSLFAWIFRWFKGVRLVARTPLNPALTSVEKSQLRKMVWRYGIKRDSRPVLVHGDLHVAHVLVDTAHNTLGIIDLETMHIGKPATNFAQIWDGFHYADAWLGKELYRLYAAKYGDELDEQFDNDVRVEVALRSYTHMRVGRNTGNHELTDKAQALFHAVLSGASFHSLLSEHMI